MCDDIRTDRAIHTDAGMDATPQMPVWNTNKSMRNTQANTYIAAVQSAAHVPRGIDDATRKQMRRTMLATAFPAASGMPDPAGWVIAVKESPSGKKYEMSHPNFNGGKVYRLFTDLARAAADFIFDAAHAPAAVPGGGPAAGAAGEAAADGGGADNADAAGGEMNFGVLNRAEQLLGPTGPIIEYDSEKSRVLRAGGAEEEDDVPVEASDLKAATEVRV